MCVNKEQEGRGASTNITEAAMLSATGVRCKGGERRVKRRTGGDDERYTRKDKRKRNAVARAMRSANTMLKRELNKLEG